MPIQILPDEVASQIAAGEVVERPASAVKELLENALDAGAGQIIIRLEKAGKKLIEVLDDGAGIAYDQIELAVARHATSKLHTANDLQNVRTLGFRGEALASIGSVSHLTLLSRTADAQTGGRLVVEGGHITEIAHAGLPVGTTVTVRDLFYNVPARLKFLKTDPTERQRIDEFVTRYAFAYHRVRFQLQHDGKTMLQTHGPGDRRETMASLYGVDLAKQMIEVSLDEGDFKVEGYTSPISLTRSNRKEITFFVNGRWIQDNALSSALLHAYQTYLMVGRYPIAVLMITMPPEMVDVNVHPTKAEVRFEDSGAIFSRVQRAVRRALLAYSPVPQLPNRLWHPNPSSQSHEMRYDPPVFIPEAEDSGDVQVDLPPVSIPSQVSLPSSQIPLLRLIGQVGATYIVAEGPDGLYLIDQHAAHERVLYEKFTRQSASEVLSQALLDPVTVQLTPDRARLLEGSLDVLSQLGFVVESFGPQTFRVRSIPAFISGADPAAALRSLVEEFEEDETPLANEREKRIIARICKRSAVKGGQILSVEEQTRLIHDLETCVSPRTCPHGRPTMIHLSVDLLERQFGRRGSR